MAMVELRQIDDVPQITAIPSRASYVSRPAAGTGMQLNYCWRNSELHLAQGLRGNEHSCQAFTVRARIVRSLHCCRAILASIASTILCCTFSPLTSFICRIAEGLVMLSSVR